MPMLKNLNKYLVSAGIMAGVCTTALTSSEALAQSAQMPTPVWTYSLGQSRFFEGLDGQNRNEVPYHLIIDNRKLTDKFLQKRVMVDMHQDGDLDAVFVQTYVDGKKIKEKSVEPNAQDKKNYDSLKERFPEDDLSDFLDFYESEEQEAQEAVPSRTPVRPTPIPIPATPTRTETEKPSPTATKQPTETSTPTATLSPTARFYEAGYSEDYQWKDQRLRAFHVEKMCGDVVMEQHLLADEDKDGEWDHLHLSFRGQGAYVIDLKDNTLAYHPFFPEKEDPKTQTVSINNQDIIRMFETYLGVFKHQGSGPNFSRWAKTISYSLDALLEQSRREEEEIGKPAPLSIPSPAAGTEGIREELADATEELSLDLFGQGYFGWQDWTGEIDKPTDNLPSELKPTLTPLNFDQHRQAQEEWLDQADVEAAPLSTPNQQEIEDVYSGMTDEQKRIGHDRAQRIMQMRNQLTPQVEQGEEGNVKINASGRVKPQSQK